ncbi:MAG: tetratricopeptide repeat protein [Vicinamibacterales bacterium]
MGFGALFYPWGLVLQAVALLHFARRRPEGYWLWIIVFGGGLGALIYIVAEVVPDAALLRGVVNQFSRRRRITELERIVIDNPAVGNLEELADLYLEERQFAKARALYDKVLARETDSLDPFYRRGLAEIELGDAAPAVQDLDRVIAKEPKYDFHRGIGMLAHACALAGQTDRADALFQRAVAASTLSETYYNYATFLASRQRTADARAWAERILAKKPTMPRYLRRRERPWFRKAGALLKRLPSGK